MKHIFLFTFFILFSNFLTVAQEPAKSKKELRSERQEKKVDEIREIILNKSFIYIPTQANPGGSGSIHLTPSFKVKIKNDSVFSYLPFYGVAYNVDYGGRNSAFNFDLPIKSFDIKEKKNSYRVKLKINNVTDQITYYFSISENGYATLNVTSTKRRSISFYGRIEKVG